MQNYHEKKTVSAVKISYLQNYLQANMVLDVGAGAGNYSRWVANTYPSSEVHAIDKHAMSIDNVNFYTGDLEHNLECKDLSFDTVIAFDIIEHITREAHLLAELYRVSKTNAVLIGSVPHDDDQFLPDYNLTFKHRKDLTHVRNYTKESLRQSLVSAGFTPVVIAGEGVVSPAVCAEFFPPLMRWSCKKIIGLARRIGMVQDARLCSDLFFVARKL